MRRLSLASRLGLLFAACAASVALIAGVLFNRASEAHFIELDRQLLQGNLPVFSDLLRTVHSRAELEAQRPQLEQELRRRPELALRVLGSDGQVWFSSLQQGSPSSDLHAEHWRSGENDYRTSSVTLASGARLDLLLDITHHQHFLEQMQRLIWLTVGLSALATALLGAWVARRGLAPLQRMTVAAQAISASSLTNRLQLGHAPRELADLIDAFNAMLARLEEAFARLSAFSADIAHELRTPLSNLLTQTQVILSQPREQADYREALHSNLEELQHLAQMVNDMLLLAKADNGLLPTRREPLQVGEELHLLAEYFAPLAEDAGVRLAVDGAATLDADRALLRRALSNLIDNALRFTSRGSEVRLAVSMQASQLRIDVANQGLAIAPEIRERLFDRFYRVDPARREGGAEHAGLGLAITRSIVQAHGGTIRCESADGWTRFIIELPARL
ncbi:heavy metal sensor histidine kinase [Aquipseudomonas campi]